jgi:hypothetical protein
LAGCGRSETANPSTSHGGGWQLRELTQDQNELVTLIAERIIPQTDTPGASAAKVNEFIDLMLHDWFSADEKARFFAGMAAALAFCREKYREDFMLCAEAEQIALLIELENEFYVNQSNPPPRAEFLHMMKQFTLIGYYTSEIGAGQELRLPPMGEYLGDVPLDENSRAWAW